MTVDKTLQSIDPLKKQSEVSASDMGAGLSPMSPPDYNQPPSAFSVDFDNLHPFIKSLMDEHKELLTQIESFKKVLSDIKFKRKIENIDINPIKSFLEFFHEEFISHNKKEEQHLFRILDKKLIEAGEHSSGNGQVFTGIKILEDDHIQAIRQGAVLNTLFNLYSSFSDSASMRLVFNEITKNCDELISLLEIHIFREDEIIFGQAQALLSNEELDYIASQYN